MASKIFFLVCAQAFLIQCTLSQCINRGPSLAYDGLAGPGLIGSGLSGSGLVGPGLAGPYGCGIVASSGGGFPITSISPLAPTGLSILSENTIEGSVIVGGALPFLSTVVLEGVLPTAGAGGISYGCGNGGVGIVSESPIATGIVGPGLAAPAYGLGLAGPGVASPIYGQGLAPGLGLGLGGCGCGL